MSNKQQSARVNVTDDDWVAFRMLAMQQHQSVADYLGELVRSELGQRVGKPRRSPPAPPRRSDPVRLADQQLLTELPGPRQRPQPPPWEV